MQIDDRMLDDQGHSPGSSAARALDDILATSETRVRLSDGLCTLPESAPDLEHLKQIARELCDDWSKNEREEQE